MLELISKLPEVWAQYSPFLAALFLALWALSEALAQLEGVASNSVYQLLRSALKTVLRVVFKKEV
jgi:hypothetical protein